MDLFTFSAVFHTISRIGGSFYIYTIHKPIDFSIYFSYRIKRLRILGHMVIGLKQVRVSSGNLVPSPSTENHLLSLSELQRCSEIIGTTTKIGIVPLFHKQ